MNNNQYVIQVDNFDALKDKLQMILDESCQGKTQSPCSDTNQVNLKISMLSTMQ